MKSLKVRHWPKLLGLLGLIFASALLAINLGQPSQAADASAHVVTVYDRGVQTTFVTKAHTVGQALKKGQIELSQQDATEPSTDTQITAKNFIVNVYRARPVLVVDGQQRQTIVTAKQGGREIAEALGKKVYPEDNITMTRGDDVLQDGVVAQVAVVDRATPITLDLYGKVVSSRTQAKTVGELLAEKNIKLGPKDGMSLSVNVPIKNGLKLRVWRDGKQTVTLEESVAFPVRQIEDKDRPVGYRQIKKLGVKGKRLVTYEITTKNGREVARKQIQSVITEAPDEQIEIIGAKPSFSGNFAEALAKLRLCESGGNYANKRNPIYRGAYQFSYQTWAKFGGYYDPADAPPPIQDQAAHQLYMRRGWQPWPVCGAGLPDIYR